MGSYYEHKRTESVNLPYSFRCEQCMQDSGFLTATVTGSASKNSHFKEISQKQDEKVRQQAHKDLIRVLKRIQKNLVEKQRVDTIFGDECPHCHKHQSWGISGMKREMFITPAVILICGIFFSVASMMGEKPGDMQYTPLTLGVIVVAVTAALISLTWNIVKINQKTKNLDTSRSQNLPVIAWEAVQYLLDEE